VLAERRRDFTVGRGKADARRRVSLPVRGAFEAPMIAQVFR
jgi:hypothetical protein